MSKPARSGDTIRIPGKRFTLPSAAALSRWKIELRPGGWAIAISPDGERIRLAALELRGKLSFLFASQPGASGFSSGFSGGGFGEVIAKSHGHGSSDAASAAAELTAQFPGKVRKILVASGARVAAGEPLVLVEAMKMEFAVKAPAPGQVTGIRVKEGQQLQPGDRLLDFEPDSESSSGPNGGAGDGDAR